MIEVKEISKSYGGRTVVDKVSLHVNKGEILVFLGPNGAGKSTTMRMITGFITPDEGEILVNGKDAGKMPIECKSEIGYLPESAPSYKDMTVTEFLYYSALIRGLDKSIISQRINETVKKTFLEGVEHKLIENLSKGYRQRVCFAQALLHDPPILIMDEPTDGLDPNQKTEVRHLIQELAKDKAILLSTHILEEMEAVGDRVIILNEGKIVFEGTPNEMLGKSKYCNAVKVICSDVNEADKVMSFKSDLNLSDAELHDNAIYLIPNNGESIISDVLKKFESEKISPSSISVEHGRADEVFRSLTT